MKIINRHKEHIKSCLDLYGNNLLGESLYADIESKLYYDLSCGYEDDDFDNDLLLEEIVEDFCNTVWTKFKVQFNKDRKSGK